jgi:CheY-like chemotaxis protein
MHALIVEDEPLTAFARRDILSACGFTSFDFAAEEVHAVELALLHPPDLVTADVHLRRGTGTGAVSAIAAHAPVAVVFVTADPREVTDDHDAPVVTKPVTERALQTAIDAALHH